MITEETPCIMLLDNENLPGSLSTNTEPILLPKFSPATDSNVDSKYSRCSLHK